MLAVSVSVMVVVAVVFVMVHILPTGSSRAHHPDEPSSASHEHLRAFVEGHHMPRLHRPPRPHLLLNVIILWNDLHQVEEDEAEGRDQQR
jgi:hypothetical protein